MQFHGIGEKINVKNVINFLREFLYSAREVTMVEQNDCRTQIKLLRFNKRSLSFLDKRTNCKCTYLANWALGVGTIIRFLVRTSNIHYSMEN